MHNKITLSSKVIQKHNLTLAWHSQRVVFALYCVIYIGGKKSRVICTGFKRLGGLLTMMKINRIMSWNYFVI